MLGLLTVSGAQMANGERGDSFLSEEHISTTTGNMITEVALEANEHLSHALTGSCCENCCLSGFTDIQKTFAQMEIPQR